MENSSSLMLDRLVGEGCWPAAGWSDPDCDVTHLDEPADVDDEGYPDIPEDVWREVVQALLEAIEPAAPGGVEVWQFTDEQLLAELVAAQRSRARVEARWLTLLAEADARQACETQDGLSTAGWLVHQYSHSPRRARQEVGVARSLKAHPAVGTALGEGRLSAEQAGVIGHSLDQLADTLGAADHQQVTDLLIGLAQEFGPPALRQLAAHAVEVVAPEIAEESDRAAVERAERAAERSRYLSWHRDLDGGLLFNGKLPAVEGDRFEALIKAHAARPTTDTDSESRTLWSAACADALTSILTHYSGCAAAPDHGGDRPRILVTLDLHTLIDGVGTATLLGSGQPITAHTARRLACDAGLLPAVLDGASQPLDVGREQRLFTGPLRHALILRDQGCSFPACDRQPADCDGHHIRPWWAGGHTKLSNGVLLCQRHHNLIEPDPRTPPGSQWEARLDHQGLPEYLAPTRPGQAPDQRQVRQHHRYRLRKLDRHNE